MWVKSYPPRRNKVPRQYTGDWRHHMREREPPPLWGDKDGRWRQARNQVATGLGERFLNWEMLWSSFGRRFLTWRQQTEAITDQVRKLWVSSMDLIDVRIRLQFLPLTGRIWDPFKLVESMEKGVWQAFPCLIWRANRSCWGIASATSK